MRIARIVLSLIFVSCLMAAAVPATPALAAGTISIYPINGSPTSSVSVNGGGFTPNKSFTVTFNSATIASGTTDATGNVVVGFSVPPMPRGTYSVQVTTTAGPGDTSNVVTFSVTPVIITDTGSGGIGDLIRVSGYGFAASSAITINFDGGGGTGGNSDANGSFMASVFTIPPTTPGRHILQATDGFAYSPEIPIVVGSKLTVTPNVSSVGSQVSMSGSGFATNSPISFYVDSVAVVTSPVLSDGSGSISASIAIPPVTQGSHVLKAQDLQGYSASTTLIIRPTLNLSPQTGTPGITVQVSGKGFAASVPVTITYSAASITTDPATPSSDASGSFGATFTAPPGGAGAYAVQASDGTNTAGATFSISAGASLGQTAGTVGSGIDIKGINFGSGATVTITYDGAAVATSIAGISGAFSATFKAPISQGGNHQVVASDSLNRVVLNFTVQPSMSITPTTGTVGSSVSVSGLGFAAGRAVSVKYDNVQVAAGTPDNTGSFSTTFKTPGSQSGVHQVVATDAVNTMSLTFTVQPSTSLSPATGSVSSNITVSGAGFAGGKTASISYDNNQLATAVVDATGSFSVTLKAPSSRGGSHQLSASDGASTVNMAFSILPSINVSPASGNVGTSVAAVGSGFASSAPVAIRYDSGQVAQVTTDASGAFSATFSAPASKGGDHMVTVSDGTSTLTSTFAMDSTPPTAPLPQLPVDGTKSDALTLFGWSAVTDPSGVTYSLQIASDAAFSSIVLDKKGLTAPGYTVADQEKLKSVSKEHPYYWRVKAVDGAANESAWTAPKSFYVGFILSSGGLYAIFAAVVVLVGLLGFWLGRRSQLMF